MDQAVHERPHVRRHQLDFTAALANIQKDLDSSLSSPQWVLDAYTLPVAGLLLTAATIGDRLGRRRLYMIGMALSTVASLGCALAGNALVLNDIRAVPGLGAVMLFGVGLPYIAAAFPEAKKRAGAIGAFGATLAAATAVGPLLGGALVDGPGWRWIFLINVPVGVAALIGQAGMATGTANTFRQIGLAADVAALGTMAVALQPLPLPAVARQQLTDAVGSGAGVQVDSRVPVALQATVAQAARAATAGGINTVFTVGAVAAAVVTVVAYVMMRKQPAAAV